MDHVLHKNTPIGGRLSWRRRTLRIACRRQALLRSIKELVPDCGGLRSQLRNFALFDTLRDELQTHWIRTAHDDGRFKELITLLSESDHGKRY